MHYIKYMGLECFGLEEYDQIFYFGADMLNVRDLTEMENFSPGSPLCMARENNRKDTFNNGGMIVRKPILNKNLPDELFHHDGRTGYGNDQALIADFFKGRITESDSRFNALITESPPADVVNWHYIIKPTTNNFVSRCGQDFLTLYDKYRLMP
jgi:hypothetical protein